MYFFILYIGFKLNRGDYPRGEVPILILLDFNRGCLFVLKHEFYVLVPAATACYRRVVHFCFQSKRLCGGLTAGKEGSPAPVGRDDFNSAIEFVRVGGNRLFKGVLSFIVILFEVVREVKRGDNPAVANSKIIRPATLIKVGRVLIILCSHCAKINVLERHVPGANILFWSEG